MHVNKSGTIFNSLKNRVKSFSSHLLMCMALSRQRSPRVTCGIVRKIKSVQDQVQDHLWDAALHHVDVFIKTHFSSLCVYECSTCSYNLHLTIKSLMQHFFPLAPASWNIISLLIFSLPRLFLSLAHFLFSLVTTTVVSVNKAGAW